jgi:transposase InsO family protein
MSQGPASYHGYNQLVEDLSGEINRPKNYNKSNEPNNENNLKCPHLLVLIGGFKVQALVDSGSQLTCVSEDFYHQLTRKNELTELPVSNLQILPAFGRSSVNVKKQILIDMFIEHRRMTYAFIVVPRLSAYVILGDDWLSVNNVKLDYHKGTIDLDGSRIGSNSVSYSRDFLDEFESSDNITYVQNVKHDRNSFENRTGRSCLMTRTNANIYTRGVFLERNNEYDNITNVAYENSDDNCVKNPTLENICEIVNNMPEKEDVIQNNDEIVIVKSMSNENVLIHNNSMINDGDVIKNVEIVDNSMLVLDDNSNFEILLNGQHEDIKDELYINDNLRELSNPNLCQQIIMSDSMENVQLQQLEENPEDNNFFEELRMIACKLTIQNPMQKDAIINLLVRYKNLFSDKPGCTTIYEHKIRLTSDRPFLRKTYPIPFALRDAVDLEIQEMLKVGIIERSVSPFCNPLRIVKKKDGRVRLCLDARYLNDIIESDNESPPLINDLLQTHYGTEYFSSVDLTHGYWQVPLENESRCYTAFLHGSTLYQFCRIPFGLKTAGSGFIRALNLAFNNEFSNFLTTYIDDLLISSKSFEQHLEHLNLIFNRLQKHNFTLRLSKSLFFQKSIPFLGFVLSGQGVYPDPEKIKIIQDFSQPKNKKQLQQFLGICNYYRQFSLKYANFIEPFRNLLKNNIDWDWSTKHTEAFTALKNNFLKAVTLNHVDFNRKFKLQTDASDHGISGILYQTSDAGDQYIIGLVSRCLLSAEINYCTTEKELLAIVYSVTKFRVYLIGNQFEIITDHKGLTFLNTTSFQNSRLIRWSLLLQQYNFKISYCKGKDNIIADFFSRNPEGEFRESKSNDLIISKITSNFSTNIPINSMKPFRIDLGLSDILKDISRLQKLDTKLKPEFNKIKIDNAASNYKIHNDVLFISNKTDGNWKIVIPNSLTRDLINRTHSKLGHVGVYKTTYYLKTYCYWKNMAKEIKTFVLHCDLCQRTKHLNYSMEGEYNMVESKEKGDLITVDFYGPLPRSVGGVQYILVVLDAFTKYVVLYPMKKATTQVSLSKIINHYIPKFGKPNRILSDNGTQFTSEKWKIELQKLGIKVCFSSIRHPQSNPTERVMRELGKLFRVFCSEKHTKWSKFIPNIEQILNITVSQSTGYTPYQLQFDSDHQDKIKEIIKYPANKTEDKNFRIELAKERLAKNFHKRQKKQKGKSKVKLKINDLVLIRVPIQSSALDRVTQKFFHLFQGPYRITKIIGNNAYQLSEKDDPFKIKGTYNRANLRPYYQSI